MRLLEEDSVLSTPQKKLRKASSSQILDPGKDNISMLEGLKFNQSQQVQNKSRKSSHVENSQDSCPQSSFKQLKKLKKLIHDKRSTDNKQSKFKSQNLTQHSTESNCPICLNKTEDNVVGILECSHQFCIQCIVDWAEVTNLCPLCRTEFLCILKRNIADPQDKGTKIQVEEKK